MAIIKYIKLILNIFVTLIILMIIYNLIMFIPLQNSNIINNNQNVAPFKLNNNEITYDNSNNTQDGSTSNSTIHIYNLTRHQVLDNAKAMTEVKWTPKHDISDKYGLYKFIKGKTYFGIPYSEDSYQVSSVDDFLSKISDSNILYGNDCSSFVSTAWGISRQTTLTLLNAVKNHSKIDGNYIDQISWDDITGGDALLIDNGKGKGHIMLYINTDEKNNDKLNVYEQNIQTLIPFEPVPVARKDIRSKSTLIKEGYIPIRLNSLD